MGTLTIWTNTPKSKILHSLGASLSSQHGLDFVVDNDVEHIPPGDGVVLALGTDTIETLKKLEAIGSDGKKLQKNRTITSLRNQLVMCKGRKYIVSYSPGIHERDYSMYIDLLCDTRLAARMAVTGSYKPLMGVYTYVDSFASMIEEIKAMYAATGKPVDVSHDTETLGKDPWAKPVGDHPGAYIVTLQFTHKPGTAQIMHFKSKQDYEKALDTGLYEQLFWLFNTEMISLRLANGKYDLVWHYVHTRAIECTNFKFDTTLVGNLLDENRSNGLDVHAKIYTSLGGYSDEFDMVADKSRMDLEYKKDPDSFKIYAGGDTDACLQISTVMKEKLLQNKRLTSFYVNILHPAARAFEVIERGGVFVNEEEYKMLEADLRTEIDNLTKEAVGILGGRIYAKHRDDTKTGGINLTKASLICDFMFSPAGLGLKPLMLTSGGKDGKGEKKPSTALDHLLKFKNHPQAGPFVQILEKYSGTHKTLTNYVVGFKKHLRSDGRFHPSYFLFNGNHDNDEGGTVTGRLSARDPAFQTIPKHTYWGKRIRRVFSAPPGYYILERDYSQGELRVVACIANELTMLKAYIEGKDLHVVTGAKIAGMTYDQVMLLQETDPEKFDSIRQPAKPANFGLLYGQGVDGFQAYAESNYGVILSDEEAQIIHSAFFELYNRLPKFHEDYKKFAHDNKCVVSPLGRIRRLPLINSSNFMLRGKAERQAINSPVQSTLTDMMEWALAIEWQQGGFKTSPCFGQIHDASYDYVPENMVESEAKRKQELMENLPFHKVGWNPQLKFKADVKVGLNMADLKKVKIAA